MQFRKEDAPAEEDDVPYGYGFFHFVFATGAMYFAMLLIGWNSHHSMRKYGSILQLSDIMLCAFLVLLCHIKAKRKGGRGRGGKRERMHLQLSIVKNQYTNLDATQIITFQL